MNSDMDMAEIGRELAQRIERGPGVVLRGELLGEWGCACDSGELSENIDELLSKYVPDMGPGEPMGFGDGVDTGWRGWRLRPDKAEDTKVEPAPESPGKVALGGSFNHVVSADGLRKGATTTAFLQVWERDHPVLDKPLREHLEELAEKHRRGERRVSAGGTGSRPRRRVPKQAADSDGYTQPELAIEGDTA